MTLAFSERDRALLEGELGPACAMAMRILVRMARIQGASSFLDVTGAHIDSALYMGEATLEYAERLADLVGQKVVVTGLLNETRGYRALFVRAPEKMVAAPEETEAPPSETP